MNKYFSYKMISPGQLNILFWYKLQVTVSFSCRGFHKFFSTIEKSFYLLLLSSVGGLFDFGTRSVVGIQLFHNILILLLINLLQKQPYIFELAEFCRGEAELPWNFVTVDFPTRFRIIFLMKTRRCDVHVRFQRSRNFVSDWF